MYYKDTQKTENGGAFRWRASAAASIVLDVNIMAEEGTSSSLLLLSEFKMVQLFLLATAARCVAMETTVRETIHELILLEFSELYTSPPAENRHINEGK